MTCLSRILAALVVFGSAAGAAERPNVVMIISDDQAWGDFGFMGHGAIQTPNLDRLAHQSAVFVNGYVTTPLCRPSLATMLTGLYPHQHRICCNDPPDRTDREPMLRFIRESATVPRLLAEAGYRTLQTGKLWEGHYENAGFTHGMTEKGRHGDAGLVIGRETMQPIFDFIRQRGDAPFFVWYAPMMPHTPHNPPERLLQKYAIEGRHPRLAAYWAMCEWFDETCGELLEFLDAEGLSDNTLVLFVVDNGWIQNTSAEARPAQPFAARSKRTAYEGGVRTPTMIRWPDRIRPGRYTHLVSSVDIAPTLLEACGITPPPGMTGLNLLPAANGRPLERDAIFGEVYLHSAVDLEAPARNLTHRWVRQRDWKLILPQPVFPGPESERYAPERHPTHPELYNLAEDPHETQNLAGQHPERVQSLAQLLDAWWPAAPPE